MCASVRMCVRARVCVRVWVCGSHGGIFFKEVNRIVYADGAN